ncbi:MAG: hypothetical protein RMA76_05320 [Deltaproteobacteria bacterium]|jgi:hypothetical protein
MSRRFTTIGLLCFALAACRSEGRVALRFSIENLPTDLTGLFLHVQVVDADDDVLSGSIVPAARDAQLALSVPHGDDRSAVVELRDSASPATSNVIAYGVSNPFSLHPGDDTVVEAVVVMRPVPAIVDLDVPDVVRDPNVVVSVTADREDIAQIVLAQDPSMTFGRQVFDAASGLSVVYDIDAPCRDGGGCADGRRNVFARLVDDAGYSSTATSTPLVVDTKSPGVLPGSGTVQFVEPAELLTPTSASTGITVRLTFVFDEPVTSTPTVTLADSGLTFDLVRIELGAYVFERVVTSLDPEGVQRPLVQARDRAGNEAPAPAPDLEYLVDHVPPAAPAVDAEETIVYRRSPYREATEGGPSFTVVGAAGAIEGGARVVVYDRAEAFVDGVEVANRAGAADAAADGSFVVQLAPVDLPEVYVLVLDRAGNPHGAEATRVRDIVWTLPAGVSGGTPPPVDVFTVDRLPTTARFDGAGVVDVDDLAPLARADGAGIESRYDLRWTEWLPATTAMPEDIRFAATAEDPERGRLVVFGGRTANDLVRTTTWEWDGQRWRSFSPTGAEPVCDDGSVDGSDPFGAMTYHGALGLTLAVCRHLDPLQAPPLPMGGVDVMEAFGWDGARWRSVPIEGGTEPVGRTGAAVAYDRARGRTVMFGGNTSSLLLPGAGAAALGDTWELEAIPTERVGVQASLRWTEHAAAGPPARDRHAMVYAPSLGGVVLFGGFSAAPDRHPLDDLWIWDGATWTEVEKSGAWPPARALHTLVYDPRSGNVGVLGGVDAEPASTSVDLVGEGLADAWWFDGTTWTETPTTADAPRGPGIAAGSLEHRGDVFALTGVVPEAEPRASQTFVVDAARWSDRTPSGAIPPQTGRQSLLYDSGRDLFWLLTSSGSYPDFIGELWFWSDAGWRFVSDELPFRETRSAVFDDRLGQALLLGTVDLLPSELEFSHRVFVGDGADWLQASTVVDGQPLGFFNGAGFIYAVFQLFLYDRALDRPVVLALGGFDPVQATFTGFELFDWTNPTWRSLGLHPAFTERPSIHIAYDDRSGRYLAQTSDLAGRATYAYDGQSWSSIGGTEGDWNSVRGMVSDVARRRVLTVGSSAGRARTWAWDGAGYRAVTTVGSAPARTIGRGIAYDGRRHRVLVLESREAGIPFDAPAGAVYALDAEPNSTPALAFRARLAAGGVAPGLVRSVGIEADAGGTGYTATATVSTGGVVLAAYDRSAAAWVPLAASTADASTPARLGHALTPSELSRVLRADDAELLVALRTSEGLGAGPAGPRVNADHLTLVVTYRLPDQ